jgi:uncharacterized protein (DUF2147 family)
MAKLSAKQRDFLKRHKIPLSRTFDATGLSTSDYKQRMKALDKWIAYGVTECQRAGHTLRTRAGHCIQCDIKKIAYLKRHQEDGEIYVAYSARGKIVKVGTSKKSATVRVNGMNSDNYGGCCDWTIVYIVAAAQAGRIESKAHRALAEHSISASYNKNGKTTKCRELFSCSVVVAKRAIMDALGLRASGTIRAAQRKTEKPSVKVNTIVVPAKSMPKVHNSRSAGAEMRALMEASGSRGSDASKTVKRKTEKQRSEVKIAEALPEPSPKVHHIWRFGHWTKYRL